MKSGFDLAESNGRQAVLTALAKVCELLLQEEDEEEEEIEEVEQLS